MESIEQLADFSVWFIAASNFRFFSDSFFSGVGGISLLIVQLEVDLQRDRFWMKLRSISAKSEDFRPMEPVQFDVLQNSGTCNELHQFSSNKSVW